MAKEITKAFIEGFQKEALFSSSNSRDNSKFRVEDVFSITGRGTIASGKVSSGKIKAGDSVKVKGRPVKVKGIEQFNEILNEVGEGEKAGLFLDGIEPEELERGMIIKGVNNG